MTEYVYDAAISTFITASGTGTGTATIEAFLASDEVRVNVTFAGLSSPTDNGDVSVQIPTSNNVDELNFLYGVPFNVTSGFFSNTTSVAMNVIQDLVHATESSKVILNTVAGFLYGEFSPCAQVATTSFTAAKTNAQRTKSLRVAALDEAVSRN